MVERNAGLLPERRIEFRIGIHLGDVVEESDGDLMGDGVNIAARLEGVAAPGAICLSEDAYRQVSARLDMAVTDLGPTQLKNIERAIRAYSLQVGVPAEAKPRVSEHAPSRRSVSPFAPLAAALAALLVVGAGSAWRCSCCRPASVAAKHARSGRAAFDRRAALCQPVGRSDAGCPRRRPYRRTDHQSRAPPRHLRHRPQHGDDLQGQGG